MLDSQLVKGLDHLILKKTYFKNETTSKLCDKQNVREKMPKRQRQIFLGFANNDFKCDLFPLTSSLPLVPSHPQYSPASQCFLMIVNDQEQIDVVAYPWDHVGVDRVEVGLEQPDQDKCHQNQTERSQRPTKRVEHYIIRGQRDLLRSHMFVSLFWLLYDYYARCSLNIAFSLKYCDNSQLCQCSSCHLKSEVQCTHTDREMPVQTLIDPNHRIYFKIF